MADNMRKPNAHSRAVADQIRAERAAIAGLTRDDVWKAAGLSRSTYARIENGKHVVDTAELGSIAAVFNLTSAQLLARAEQRLKMSDSERAALDKAIRRKAGDDPIPDEGHGQGRSTGS